MLECNAIVRMIEILSIIIILVFCVSWSVVSKISETDIASLHFFHWCEELCLASCTNCLMR